jgi:hypothetical protein
MSAIASASSAFEVRSNLTGSPLRAYGRREEIEAEEGHSSYSVFVISLPFPGIVLGQGSPRFRRAVVALPEIVTGSQSFVCLGDQEPRTPTGTESGQWYLIVCVRVSAELSCVAKTGLLVLFVLSAPGGLLCHRTPLSPYNRIVTLLRAEARDLVKVYSPPAAVTEQRSSFLQATSSPLRRDRCVRMISPTGESIS